MESPTNSMSLLETVGAKSLTALIDETLAAESTESELDRALELLRRRFPAPPRDRRERNRALGVMLRKGYDSELALDALAAYAAGPDPATF